MLAFPRALVHGLSCAVGHLRGLFLGSDKVMMLVTSDAPEGFTEYVDYSYELVYKENGPHKRHYPWRRGPWGWWWFNPRGWGGH